MIDTIKAVLENTQNRTPMVHSITNNVTINDCANIILAAGGTAIMAQDEREVEEITSYSTWVLSAHRRPCCVQPRLPGETAIRSYSIR